MAAPPVTPKTGVQAALQMEADFEAKLHPKSPSKLLAFSGPRAGYSPGVADTLALFASPAAVPAPGVVAGAHTTPGRALDGPPHRAREEARQLVLRLEERDRAQQTLTSTTTQARAFADQVEYAKDAAQREVAALYADRERQSSRSLALRSAATAEVVATVAAVHRNTKERQDLRSTLTAQIAASQAAVQDRCRVSREAESELRNVDMARDSTVRNVQALKDETRKVHQTQAEVARLKQKASHYAAECQLLAEHALSLGRANAATDVAEGAASAEAEAALEASKQLQEDLQFTEAQVRRTETDLHETTAAANGQEQRILSLTSEVSDAELATQKVQREVPGMQRKVHAMRMTLQQRSAELAAVERERVQLDRQIQGVTSRLERTTARLGAAQSSNREEELHLEAAQQQRERHRAEVVDRAETVRQEATALWQQVDDVTRESALTGERTALLADELAGVQDEGRALLDSKESTVRSLEAQMALLSSESAELARAREEAAKLAEMLADLERQERDALVAADKAETSLRVAREELRLQEAAAVRADLELAAEEKLFAEEHEDRDLALTDLDAAHREAHEKHLELHGNHAQDLRKQQEQIAALELSNADLERRVADAEDAVAHGAKEEATLTGELEDLRARQASAARAIQDLAAQKARAAQDGERRARALEDEKANLVQEFARAEEKRTDFSSTAETRLAKLRDTERESRTLEQSYSAVQRTLREDVREVQTAASACAATWDAEQKARAAEEKEVEGLKQDLEKKIDQVQEEHRLHMARLAGEEKRLREAATRDEATWRQKLEVLGRDGARFAADQATQVQKIARAEEALWALQRELGNLQARLAEESLPAPLLA